MSPMVWALKPVSRANSALGTLVCKRIACKTTRSLNCRMPTWLDPRGRNTVGATKEAFGFGAWVGIGF